MRRDVIRLEEILNRLHREPDPVKRLEIRLNELPLGYLATTEARTDVEVLIRRISGCEDVRQEGLGDR